jgi:hypothetical protein
VVYLGDLTLQWPSFGWHLTKTQMLFAAFFLAIITFSLAGAIFRDHLDSDR